MRRDVVAFLTACLKAMATFMPLTKSASRKYRRQSAKIDRGFLRERPELERHVDVMILRPVFIVLVTGATIPFVSKLHRQLQKQLYPDWKICQIKEEVPELALTLSGRLWYLIWLDQDVLLHAGALYSFANAVNLDREADVIYGDEDKLVGRLFRTDPFYKPDWSPDYLEACNFVGPATCVRDKIALASLAESDGHYDFILRVTERARGIVHVRRPLAHRRRDLTHPRNAIETRSDIAALEGRLTRTGRRGSVAPIRPGVACYDIKLSLRSNPLVSIVIPTAGKIKHLEGREIDLILNCLEGIRNRSTYKSLEIIVVHNGDIDHQRMDLIRSFDVSTIVYDEPEVNIAKKLNLGASLASGEFLLLLNDDVVPLVPDWIERMLDHFEKPHVGVVGAKLLYPEMTTQHVGVVLNRGNPAHVRIRTSREDDGYFFSTCAVRNFVAVTGAVMLTPTDLYRAVGGYTDTMAMGFNDVDYCFKLARQGARIVYAPKCELIHYESVSRGPSADMEDLHTFHQRWSSIATDPFYNEEALTVWPADYRVDLKPRFIG